MDHEVGVRGHVQGIVEGAAGGQRETVKSTQVARVP